MAPSIQAAQRERPIIFSGGMVRAILDGRKTQTRRVVKPQPCQHEGIWIWRDGAGGGLSHESAQVLQTLLQCRCPYAIGDRLWVRETWGYVDPATCDDNVNYRTVIAGDGAERHIVYAATRDLVEWNIDDGDEYDSRGRRRSCWKPSIHMPRFASRITLEVTGVRAQRVQDINDEDCAKEGIAPWLGGWDQKPETWWQGYDGRHSDNDGNLCHTQVPADTPPNWMIEPKEMTVRPIEVNRRAVFQELWDALNAKRGCGWEENPWVWVIEFRRIAEPNAQSPMPDASSRPAEATS